MKSHKNNPLYFCTLLLSLIVSNFVHAAEYIYISDNLRVGVRTKPVSGIPPISVVFTGMRLKVEERLEGYIKVTTPKGITGWIKDIYATDKTPAIIQLNELHAKHDKLIKERATDLDTISTLEETIIALNEQIAELKVERDKWENDQASLVVSQDKESSWLWLAGIGLLILISFIAGAMWYRTQAMKRLGGLRV